MYGCPGLARARNVSRNWGPWACYRVPCYETLKRKTPVAPRRSLKLVRFQRFKRERERRGSVFKVPQICKSDQAVTHKACSESDHIQACTGFPPTTACRHAGPADFHKNKKKLSSVRKTASACSKGGAALILAEQVFACVRVPNWRFVDGLNVRGLCEFVDSKQRHFDYPQQTCLINLMHLHAHRASRGYR